MDAGDTWRPCWNNDINYFSKIDKLRSGSRGCKHWMIHLNIAFEMLKCHTTDMALNMAGIVFILLQLGFSFQKCGPLWTTDLTAHKTSTLKLKIFGITMFTSKGTCPLITYYSPSMYFCVIWEPKSFAIDLSLNNFPLLDEYLKDFCNLLLEGLGSSLYWHFQCS